MPSISPPSLTENANLAFTGEQPWAPAQLTPRQAKSFEKAANPTGRSNIDVIRRFVGIKAGHIEEHVQVDFPAHFSEQEAALYVKPFNHLRAAHRSLVPAWWLNPNAQSELRTTLARLDRFLATPLVVENPAWDWIDSQLLPGATLLAVARDDDFAYGLLQSRFFNSWWCACSPRLPPAEIIETFPFPWPPATSLSALNRTQEEHRLAIARAARSGEQSSLDPAVAAAYNWLDDLDDATLVANLTALSRQRIAGGTRPPHGASPTRI